VAVGRRLSTGAGSLEAAAGSELLIALCWGALLGGALQLGVQLPAVARCLSGFRLTLSTRVEGVRAAFVAFLPVVLARGVAQLTSYLEILLASLLAAGAQAALGWAQRLYLLPIALFGASVAAAELPELSRLAHGGAPAGEERAERVRAGLAQSAFLTVPTAIGYWAFGLLLVAGLYRRGAFGAEDSWLVYLVLAALTAGLVPTTWSRLLQNSFYAVGDTRRPARIAVLRMGVSAALGAALMIPCDRLPAPGGSGTPSLFLGALGLAAGSAVAAWLELAALDRALRRQLATLRLPWGSAAVFLAVAALAALPAAALWWTLAGLPALLTAPAVVATFAGTYLGGCLAVGRGEARAWLGRVRRPGGSARRRG